MAVRVRPEEIQQVGWPNIRFVYVVGEGDAQRPCKIGYANVPQWRLSSLQSGNWRRLKLLACWRCETKAEALRLEAAVLSRFESDIARAGGEWIDVSADELIVMTDILAVSA